jgi:hypothetical protein
MDPVVISLTLNGFRKLNHAYIIASPKIQLLVPDVELNGYAEESGGPSI